MRKNLVNVTIFLITTLLIWVYWTSNVQTNETVLVLKKINTQLHKPIIEPSAEICGQSVLLIIIVTSYVGHVELRSAHRRAMTPDLLKSLNITRVFLLAKIPETEKYITQDAIIDESNTFGDIIQGSFTENYRNLTYKHLMGLHWASVVCSHVQVSYILKVDDDTVFNLDKTYDLLLKLNNVEKDKFLMGYILNNTKPRRNKENKWYVTRDEYLRNDYPPYLSGWYYLTTPQVAAKLYDEAVHHPYFWIDDIYVTGLLAEALKLKLRQLPENYWLEYYELVECCLRDMVKKFIKCENVVGPNGGRNNLIVEFNNALKHCNIWKNCTTRTNSLKNVCVTYRQRTIFSDGEAELQYIKL